MENSTEIGIDNNTQENNMEFEVKMQRLETIVEKLNNSNIPLKESVALYEEGAKLLKELNEELDMAEKTVKVLTENKMIEEFE